MQSNVLGYLARKSSHSGVQLKCHAPDWNRPYLIMREYLNLPMPRRLLVPLWGRSRWTYVIFGATRQYKFGEFYRKMTLLDRYVLDLSMDRERKLDRRVGLAIGVMLALRPLG